MRKFLILTICYLLLAISYLPTRVLAHVVIKPDTVGISKFQTFTIGVPVEKEIATTQLRLVLPKGLNHVSPNVKPGWNIEIIKKGENISEVVWSNGYIPPGQRDDFLFSAQAPSSEGNLKWLAYQTYEDGTVVSWDQISNHNTTLLENKGPYSSTKVINDLTTEEKEIETTNTTPTDNMPLYLSLIAVLTSGLAIWLQINKKK